MGLLGIGLGLAQQAASGGLGLLFQKHNDKRQLEQQRKLQDLQISGQKELTDYSYDKQYSMWEKTNYGAQKEQLIKAGLNPGLLYGMSGGGGTTTGTAGNTGTSGGQAPTGGREVQDAIGMGMQLQLLKAQKENIEADTKNKLSQVPKAGQEIEESKARISLMAQQEDNARWTAELLRLDKALKDLDVYKGSALADEQINKFKTEVQTAMADMRSKMSQANVDEQTQNTKIEQAKVSLAGEYLTNALKAANINLTEQETFKVVNDIAQGWQKLRIEEQEMYIKQYVAKISGSAIPAYLMTDIVKTLGGIFTAGQLFKPKAPNTVQGFGRGNNQ